MKYKETDIQWLGKIPEHWDTTTIKNHFYVIPSNVDKKTKENEIPVELCNYVDVYYNDFIDLSVPFMEATANENEVVKFQLKEKDVLITKDSEDPLDIGVPALINEVKDKLLCGYHLSMLRPKSNKITGDYLFWLLKDTSIASQLWREATGVTRWAIASRHVKNSIIALPPKKEQIAIANYLDNACERIDKIVKIKEKQILKLDNYFKNKISEFTTQGLGSSVLTPTDCLWIPEIKKGWKIKPLKRLLNSKLKYGANEPAINEDTTEPRYIRITDFSKDGKLKNNTFKSLPFDKAKEYLLKEGDVLFARSGATVGKTFIFKDYDGIACFAGYLIKAECNQDLLLPEYLYFFTKSKGYEEWKNIIFTQATIQNIGADKYQYLKISIPPSIEEQREIVDKIINLQKKIDDTKSKIKNQIKTLKNYRKSLIHECVTGKKQIVKAMETVKN
ncbi:MAG TPA: hypothetical protein EYO76_13785 [Flavobacteriaceae bacterium]|nr:hypothetical protein [Flavobacteriaceae bacterium]